MKKYNLFILFISLFTTHIPAMNMQGRFGANKSQIIQKLSLKDESLEELRSYINQIISETIDLQMSVLSTKSSVKNFVMLKLLSNSLELKKIDLEITYRLLNTYLPILEQQELLTEAKKVSDYRFVLKKITKALQHKDKNTIIFTDNLNDFSAEMTKALVRFNLENKFIDNNKLNNILYVSTCDFKKFEKTATLGDYEEKLDTLKLTHESNLESTNKSFIVPPPMGSLKIDELFEAWNKKIYSTKMFLRQIDIYLKKIDAQKSNIEKNLQQKIKELDELTNLEEIDQKKSDIKISSEQIKNLAKMKKSLLRLTTNKKDSDNLIYEIINKHFRLGETPSVHINNLDYLKEWLPEILPENSDALIENIIQVVTISNSNLLGLIYECARQKIRHVMPPSLFELNISQRKNVPLTIALYGSAQKSYEAIMADNNTIYDNDSLKLIVTDPKSDNFYANLLLNLMNELLKYDISYLEISEDKKFIKIKNSYNLEEIFRNINFAHFKVPKNSDLHENYDNYLSDISLRKPLSVVPSYVGIKSKEYIDKLRKREDQNYAERWAELYEKQFSSLKQSERSAIYIYTDRHYAIINAFLRLCSAAAINTKDYGSFSVEHVLKDIILSIGFTVSGLNKLAKHDSYLLRGESNLPAFVVDIFKAGVQQKGGLVHIPSFLSTTSAGIPAFFIGNVSYLIVDERPIKERDGSSYIAWLSSAPGENEVLLRPGTVFRVNSMYEDTLPIICIDNSIIDVLKKSYVNHTVLTNNGEVIFVSKNGENNDNIINIIANLEKNYVQQLLDENILTFAQEAQKITPVMGESKKLLEYYLKKSNNISECNKKLDLPVERIFEIAIVSTCSANTCLKEFRLARITSQKAKISTMMEEMENTIMLKDKKKKKAYIKLNKNSKIIKVNLNNLDLTILNRLQSDQFRDYEFLETTSRNYAAQLIKDILSKAHLHVISISKDNQINRIIQNKTTLQKSCGPTISPSLNKLAKEQELKNKCVKPQAGNSSICSKNSPSSPKKKLRPIGSLETKKNTKRNVQVEKKNITTTTSTNLLNSQIN